MSEYKLTEVKLLPRQRGRSGRGVRRRRERSPSTSQAHHRVCDERSGEQHRTANRPCGADAGRTPRPASLHFALAGLGRSSPSASPCHRDQTDLLHPHPCQGPAPCKWRSSLMSRAGCRLSSINLGYWSHHPKPAHRHHRTESEPEPEPDPKLNRSLPSAVSLLVVCDIRCSESCLPCSSAHGCRCAVAKQRRWREPLAGACTLRRSRQTHAAKVATRSRGTEKITRQADTKARCQAIVLRVQHRKALRAGRA